MKPQQQRTIRARAFSMIEMVIVITIIGIVAAIVAPRFADAGAGRRLAAAKRTLTNDTEMAKRLARAGGITYTLGVYPNQNMYVLVEGTDIKRDAVVFTRDFDDDPYNIDITRTNKGNPAFIVITPYGEFIDSFTVGLSDGDVEVTAAYAGRDQEAAAVTKTDPDVEVTVGPVHLKVDLGLGLGVNLGL